MWLTWIIVGSISVGMLYWLWSQSFGAFRQEWVATVTEISEVFQPKRRFLEENMTEVMLYLREENGRERTYSFIKEECPHGIKGVLVGDRVIKVNGEEEPRIDNLLSGAIEDS